tara:strand:- start:13 stop:765 length:753 start_codon:yes stop_codon:yes gene_type:complete
MSLIKKAETLNSIELSIILPCFNEAENIKNIYSEFLENIKKYNVNSQLILVNNGSTDLTWEVINSLYKKNRNIKFINLNKNKGYGGGIYNGLIEAEGEYLSWTHADGQCKLSDIFKLYLKVKDSKKIFGKGHRKNKRTKTEYLVTYFHTFLSKIILDFRMSDINAQPKIFHKTFLKKMKRPPFKYTVIDTYAYYLAIKNNYDIIKLDVVFFDRKYGTSKWKNNFKTFIVTLFMNFLFLFKLKFSRNILDQ